MPDSESTGAINDIAIPVAAWLYHTCIAFLIRRVCARHVPAKGAASPFRGEVFVGFLCFLFLLRSVPAGERLLGDRAGFRQDGGDRREISPILFTTQGLTFTYLFLAYQFFFCCRVFSTQPILAPAIEIIGKPTGQAQKFKDIRHAYARIKKDLALR